MILNRAELILGLVWHTRSVFNSRADETRPTMPVLSTVTGEKSGMFQGIMSLRSVYSVRQVT